MSGITGRRVGSSTSSTSSASSEGGGKAKRGRGRPPKIGRDPQQLVDASKVDSAQGIWSYFSPYERDRHKARVFHPEDFHVAISDDNGNDVKKQIRFHPVMWNELAGFVARGNFPVEFIDDLIRAGVFWFMGVLYALEKKTIPGVPNALPMIAAMNRRAMSSYQRRLFNESMEKIEAEVKGWLEQGYETEAAKFVFDQMEEVKLIPHRSQREPMLQWLKSKYGYLIKRNAKVVKVLKRSRLGEQRRKNYIGGSGEAE